MEKLTIIIDDWGHKELKEYLMSLNGIKSVEIKEENQLEIDLNYDSKVITPPIIKMEILFFLDLHVPSFLSFNKHARQKTTSNTLIKEDICCEYCFKVTIEKLFEIEGIEKVESNFQAGNTKEEVILNIEYNPERINWEEIKQIVSQL